MQQRADVAQAWQLVEQAYQALEEKNRELETLDRIVQSINRKISPEDVMQSLLEHGLALLPQAKRATFTLLNREQHRFEVVASRGQDSQQLLRLTLGVEQAQKRYVDGAEILGTGIYRVLEPGPLPGENNANLLPQPHPEALLTIAVSLENEVQGFIIFSVFARAEGAQGLDIDTLQRYRQHAISALDKARAYRELQDQHRQVEEKNQELLRTQEELEQRTAFLNLLIENNPLAIVALDAQGKVTMCNPAFEELFGHRQSDIAGYSLDELATHEQIVEELAKSRLLVLEGQPVYRPSARRERRDGSVVDVEVHGVPLKVDGKLQGAFALYQDITDRMRAERALFEEKERAQVTLDSIGDAVLRTDAAGNLEYMNPVAETLTGWSLDEARSQPLGAVLHVVDEPSHQRVRDLVSQCLEHDGVIAATGRRVLISRSGMEYPIRDSAAPIRGRDGEILGVVVVFKDVTGERRLAQQVIHSEKMASLGQLVAGVAHEINNPVNFISSGLPSLRRSIDELTHMVSSDPGNPPIERLRLRVDKLLQAIEDGSDRTAEIVKDLRMFSHLDEETAKIADLHQALDSTLGLLHNKTKDRIRILKTYGDVPPIECYIGQLNQVFMNLLVNAIQSIQGTGTIEIATTQPRKDRVRISIRDSGYGISVELQSKIFDPFFTTKPVGSGTGLGLSISHGIIAQHHGTIEVSSTPGEGSEFSILLPVRFPQADCA
ncbi:MAG: PAS domain S-box protein [Acidobacteriota bacterium]